MPKFYVTYGCGSNLTGRYSIVEAEDYSEARFIIHDIIGAHFAFCYNEEGFDTQIEDYGLTEVPLQAQVYDSLGYY